MCCHLLYFTQDLDVMTSRNTLQFQFSQVNLFKYLGNVISYVGELDIDNRLNNFLKITGILNNVFRIQKENP